MNNVRNIGPVASVSHADQIADGLEALADEIRCGELGFVPTIGHVVLVNRPHEGGRMTSAFFGADSSTVEIVGILELAKARTLTEAIEGG